MSQIFLNFINRPISSCQPIHKERDFQKEITRLSNGSLRPLVSPKSDNWLPWDKVFFYSTFLKDDYCHTVIFNVLPRVEQPQLVPLGPEKRLAPWRGENLREIVCSFMWSLESFLALIQIQFQMKVSISSILLNDGTNKKVIHPLSLPSLAAIHAVRFPSIFLR